MTAFVALLFAFPLLLGLWRWFKLFRSPRSERFKTVPSIESGNQNFTLQHNDRDQICCACRARIENPEAAPSQVRAQGIVVPHLYYFAAWTDSGCLLGCQHKHQTVISAANCIAEAGGYVVAVEKGRLRALSEPEEELFWQAYRGKSAVARRLLGFRSLELLKPSLN
jgi:hypothetical protein